MMIAIMVAADVGGLARSASRGEIARCEADCLEGKWLCLKCREGMLWWQRLLLEVLAPTVATDVVIAFIVLLDSMVYIWSTNDGVMRFCPCRASRSC